MTTAAAKTTPTLADSQIYYASHLLVLHRENTLTVFWGDAAHKVESVEFSRINGFSSYTVRTDGGEFTYLPNDFITLALTPRA